MILYSPDDTTLTAPPVDDNIVTFTKEEWDKEKQRLFNGGMKQAGEKFTKKEQSYMERLANEIHEVQGKPLDEALDFVIGEFKKKGADKSEEQRIWEDKVKGLTGELEKQKIKTTEAEQNTSNYIINNELLGVVGARAIDPSDAITLFRQEYRVERVQSGDIRVYDKSGELVKDTDYNPISLKGAMDLFLTKKPHLVKSDSRGGTGDKARDGVDNTPSNIRAILAKPADKQTDAEKKQVFEAYKKGLISLKDTYAS